MPGKILLRQQKNNHGEGDDQKEVLLPAGFGLWIVVLSQVLAISAPAVTGTRRSQLEVEQQRLPSAAPVCSCSG